MAAARTSGVRARQRPAGSEPAPAAGRDRKPGKGDDRLPDAQALPAEPAQQDGFTITVTAAEAQAEAEAAAQAQSVVAVRAGEQLTERQLLEALLIPSGNNVAQMLADLWRAARRASSPR